MATLLRNFKLGLSKARTDQRETQVTVAPVADRERGVATVRSLDIGPNDPLVAYFPLSVNLGSISEGRIAF